MRKRARLCREPRARTKGQLALLYVVEPGTDIPHFLGIEEVAREEGLNKARAVFRLFGRKLKAMGFEDVVPEEIVREGMKADEITKLIEEDRYRRAGARRFQGPVRSRPARRRASGGRLAGTFPVPITVVPGCLGLEDLALASHRRIGSAAPRVQIGNSRIGRGKEKPHAQDRPVVGDVHMWVVDRR